MTGASFNFGALSSAAEDGMLGVGFPVLPQMAHYPGPARADAGCECSDEGLAGPVDRISSLRASPYRRPDPLR